MNTQTNQVSIENHGTLSDVQLDHVAGGFGAAAIKAGAKKAAKWVAAAFAGGAAAKAGSDAWDAAKDGTKKALDVDVKK